MWAFAAKPVPAGMGLSLRLESVDGFLCAARMDESEQIRMAILVHAVAKAITYCRYGRIKPGEHDIAAILRLERGNSTRGTSAAKLFRVSSPAAEARPEREEETALVSEYRLRAADLL